jgi:mitochondrial protein import protein ZIM17
LIRAYATDNDNKNSKNSSSDQDVTPRANPTDPTEFQIPGAQAGGKKLAIVYTCKVCETRSVKQFSEHSYQNGVVLVRCPGCQNLHLIADRLGVFEGSFEDGKGWDIQKAMASLGENVAVVNNDNVLELTVEDLVGRDAIEKLISKAQQDSTSATPDTNGKTKKS